MEEAEKELNSLKNEIALLKERLAGDRRLFLAVAGIILAALGYTNFITIPQKAKQEADEQVPLEVKARLADIDIVQIFEGHVEQAKALVILMTEHESKVNELRGEATETIFELNKRIKEMQFTLNEDGLHYAGQFSADEVVAQKRLTNKGSFTFFGFRDIPNTNRKEHYFMIEDKEIISFGLEQETALANVGFTVRPGKLVVRGKVIESPLSSE